eukprot:8918533-Pyramimonas_sp.AAC.1
MTRARHNRDESATQPSSSSPCSASAAASASAARASAAASRSPPASAAFGSLSGVSSAVGASTSLGPASGSLRLGTGFPGSSGDAPRASRRSLARSRSLRITARSACARSSAACVTQ